MYQYQEGRDVILEKIAESNRRPFLIAVFGQSNSGKSYLIDDLAQRIEHVGGTVKRTHHLFENQGYELIANYPNGPSVFLFHCAWDRWPNPPAHELQYHEIKDPNLIVERLYARTIDLNVGIVSPHSRSRLSEDDYDLVIDNTDANQKEDDGIISIRNLPPKPE